MANPFTQVPREAEIKLISFLGDNTQLYHNTPVKMFSQEPFGAISTGTSPYNRIGNVVRALDFRARILFNNKLDRPNVTYRFLLLAVPNNTTTIDVLTEAFTSGANNLMCAFTDPALCMVLYDKVVGSPIATTNWQSGGTLVQKERSMFFEVDVPINQDVVWSQNNLTTPRAQLWPIVVAYDSYGTLTTDNIASLNVVAQLTYSDK